MNTSSSWQWSDASQWSQGHWDSGYQPDKTWWSAHTPAENAAEPQDTISKHSPRVPVPETFKQNSEYYDSQVLYKQTFKKYVEPTAWSRSRGLAGMDVRDVSVAHICRRGMEEFGLRHLSHGKFTGVILTRSIADTVLLSQIQKSLSENMIDVDATLDKYYQDKGIQPPHKSKDASSFVQPVVELFLESIKPWMQTRDYHSKNPDRDNAAAQQVQELQEQAAKYKQRLRDAGIETTPRKDLPIQDPSNASDPERPAKRGPDTAAASQPHKRKKLTQKDLEALVQEPFNVMTKQNIKPPNSMTSLKSWIGNLKGSIPDSKHDELDGHISKVTKLLELHKKPKLQELATRWGLPIALVTSAGASPKNLQQLIAAVTFFAV